MDNGFYIDEEGYLFAGPVKLFRIDDDQVECFDKDRLRSRRRGTPFVYRPISALIETLQSQQPQSDRRSETAVLELVPAGIMVLDETSIIFANRDAANILGLERQQMTLEFLASLGEAVDLDNKPLTFEMLPSSVALKTGKRVESTVGLQYDDESTMWFRVTAQPFGENRTHVIVSYVNVTTLIDMQQVQHQFMANVSHELRTPLTLIQNYSDPDVLKLSDLEELPGHMKIIHRYARSLSYLVTNILAILEANSSFVHDKFCDFDIVRTVYDAANSFRILAQKNDVALTISVPDEPLTYYGHGVQIGLVVNNLLNNAIKFSAGGMVHVSLTKDDGEIVIEVADTGEGMSPEVMRFIFDPFRQGDGGTRRKHGGTGIGLAVVKELVTLHNGRVEVKSEEGEGSTFRVALPLSGLKR